MTEVPDNDLNFRIGRRYTYRWDGGFDETEKYAGQPMRILRLCGPEDADPDAMYHVRFADGMEYDVYLEEVGAALT